jgi:16S rRNA (guanine527-N7)-methyltransferase
MTEIGALPDWLNVSRETNDRLIAYCHEITRWNRAINLVSKSTIADIWARHILDSAQIFPFGHDGDAPWADVGSGAGLPGLVMAIMGAKNMVLVESDARKATFLRETARVLGLNVQIVNKRIESVDPMGAQTMSARALAPLNDLLGLANTHLAKDGTAIFLKGRGAQDEITAAQASWRFDCQRIISKTEPESSVLVLKNIQKI